MCQRKLWHGSGSDGSGISDSGGLLFLNLNGQNIYATHGHVWNPGKLPMLKAGDILLNGHTHIPGMWKDSYGSRSECHVHESGFCVDSKRKFRTQLHDLWEWVCLNGKIRGRGLSNMEERYALLIDADNVSAKYIKPILDELSKYGNVTYKRIYGDWTSTYNSSWKRCFCRTQITPIQQFSYTPGKEFHRFCDDYRCDGYSLCKGCGWILHCIQWQWFHKTGEPIKRER